MTLKPKQGWFLAFTAVFAVLAGFVFWGTWSLSMVPVMPDCPTAFPIDSVEHWIRGWKQNGKFVPGDLVEFLGSPYFWVELKYVLATYCAALGMAYFLRGRGLSRVASYGAGLLLAFSGYWLTLFSAGHLGWFQWMTYGVFAFGLIDRALEKGRFRHWLLLGACLAWGSFYQPDLWLLFTVFTAAYFVFRWLCTAIPARTYFPLTWVKGAGIALATFLLIGLPSFRSAICSDLAGRDKQIAEGQTLAEGTEGEDARWLFVTNWSMPPEDTLEFFNARVHGDTSCPLTLAIGQACGSGIRPYTGRLGCPKNLENDRDRTVNYRQHSLYVGWLTCLLALVGLASPFVLRSSRNVAFVVFFAVSAVVFYLFSLGRFCEPVYRVVFSLPMGDYLRAPVKWHHLTEFCLVALAGFGLEMIYRTCRSLQVKPIAVQAVLGGVILIGTVDLARNAHLYCAPHRAGCQLTPAQLYQQGMFPSDPAQRTAFERTARQNGYLVVGWETLSLPVRDGAQKDFDAPYLMPQKGLKGVCGVMTQPLSNGGELHAPVVDYDPGVPPLRKQENELNGIACLMATVSVLSTLAVLAFLIATLFNRRLASK